MTRFSWNRFQVRNVNNEPKMWCVYQNVRKVWDLCRCNNSDSQTTKHPVVQLGFEFRFARLLRSCLYLHQRAPLESKCPRYTEDQSSRVGSEWLPPPSWVPTPHHLHQLPVSSRSPLHSQCMELRTSLPSSASETGFFLCVIDHGLTLSAVIQRITPTGKLNCSFKKEDENGTQKCFIYVGIWTSTINIEWKVLSFSCSQLACCRHLTYIIFPFPKHPPNPRQFLTFPLTLAFKYPTIHIMVPQQRIIWPRMSTVQKWGYEPLL